jgi:sugar lactone lactonase YvrE
MNANAKMIADLQTKTRTILTQIKHKMNHAKLLLLSAALAFAGCATHPDRSNNAGPMMGSPASLQTPSLFATLPEAVATSDGMAIAPDGDLVVACPNFADPTKPGCLLKIGRDFKPRVWVKVPPLPETGVACPMGIEFGPDGDLYVCDNQGWSGSPPTQFKGRMLRLRIQGDQVASCAVVAEGMEHPNGVRVHGDSIYVTESLMTKVKDPMGRMVSGVYRFQLQDKNVKVSNTLADPNLITSLVTINTNCPYGADGIVFDHKGNLYIGNFGDGAIHKITFDGGGHVTGNTIFAKTDLDYSLDPKSPGFLARASKARMRTTDGICVDDQDNLYVADFSNNAIAKVTPDGTISVLAQNGDTDGLHGELNEPGEPVVWKGRLIVSNFNTVVGPDKVHTKHTSPTVMSSLLLK